MSASWLIVSCKEPGVGETLLFWRPQGAGYTTDLDQAGRFTDEAVRRYCGRSARAVRLADVEARATRAVPMLASDWAEIQRFRDYERDARVRIPADDAAASGGGA